MPDLRVWVDEASVPGLDGETELALTQEQGGTYRSWRGLFTCALQPGSPVMVRTALLADPGMEWELLVVEAVGGQRRTVFCDADVVTAPKEWNVVTYER
jgi:hypothetical protein